MNETGETTSIVSAEFPNDLAWRARVAAALAGISRSELIRRATDEYIARTTPTKKIASYGLQEKSASPKA